MFQLGHVLSDMEMFKDGYPIRDTSRFQLGHVLSDMEMFKDGYPIRDTSRFQLGHVLSDMEMETNHSNIGISISSFNWATSSQTWKCDLSGLH